VATASLLPAGRLILFVKATFLIWSDRVRGNNTGTSTYSQRQLPHRENQPVSSSLSAKEDLCKTMLQDNNNLVDLGSASVLLVFEDGEMQCHTFPLAAR
jgi:hypothetical protein